MEVDMDWFVGGFRSFYASRYVHETFLIRPNHAKCVAIKKSIYIKKLGFQGLSVLLDVDSGERAQQFGSGFLYANIQQKYSVPVDHD